MVTHTGSQPDKKQPWHRINTIAKSQCRQFTIDITLILEGLQIRQCTHLYITIMECTCVFPH